jgi:hypothetical protein
MAIPTLISRLTRQTLKPLRCTQMYVWLALLSASTSAVTLAQQVPFQPPTSALHLPPLPQKPARKGAPPAALPCNAVGSTTPCPCTPAPARSPNGNPAPTIGWDVTTNKKS